MDGWHAPIDTPERVSWTCPLGLRFFDVASGLTVHDGLSVNAKPETGLGHTIKSVLTPSGVHAFPKLPGVPTIDRADAIDPWDPFPATRPFRIRVVDTLDRFLSCTFVIDAPFKGLDSPLILGSPPWSDPRGIPLFSAPARTAPAGFILARAELRQLDGDEPAAFALVEISYPSAGKTFVARGMSDAQGMVVILFPLPEGPRRGFGGSPPAGNRAPQWPGSLAFFHDASLPTDETADYGFRLTQPAATAFRDGSPALSISESLLTYSEENNLGALDLAPV
jgi:hypothetical protein